MNIWKYPLEITDIQIVEMPSNAQILSAQMQGDALCLWVLVNMTDAIERRSIEIIGTGNPMAEYPRQFISTVQMHGGALVWHVFERL